MRDSRRKLLSQNFLWNRVLVSKLIRNSSISQKDLVLDIGAGKGIITEQLLDVCKEVIAIEMDRRLSDFLKNKYRNVFNIRVIEDDFLMHKLPKEPFKVFSNIPFSTTGEIIKKLLFSKNPPVDSYLVVQTEAAEKFMAKYRPDTMIAILFYPWFDIKIIYKFKKTDFKPVPRVNSCLIRIEKRSSPLIDKSLLPFFRDYIVYYFTRDRSATSISPHEWLTRFGMFVKGNDLRMHNKIKDSFIKWQKEERTLSKIHRTRTDKGWKEC